MADAQAFVEARGQLNVALDRILELFTPTPEKLPAWRTGNLALSHRQNSALVPFRQALASSAQLVTRADLRLSPEQVVRVANWFRQKDLVLRHALEHGLALSFDVIMLGLIPISPEAVIENVAHKKITDDPSAADEDSVDRGFRSAALEFTQHRNDRSTGWSTHVNSRVSRLVGILGAAWRRVGHASRIPWASDAERLFSQAAFPEHNFLVQFGIKEILLCFEQRVMQYDRNTWNGAQAILAIAAAWSPESLVKRILDTVALAESCCNTNVWLTTLASRANPNYFHYMPLPGQHPEQASRMREHLWREIQASRPAVHVALQEQHHAGRVGPIEALLTIAGQGETDRSRNAPQHDNLADLVNYSSYSPLALNMTRRSGPHALGAEPRLSERTARRYRVDSDWQERAMQGYGRLVSRIA